MQRRYVGLSKNAPPLLQSVDRRKTDGQAANSPRNASVKFATSKDEQSSNSFQEGDFDAPPLSSDEEEEDGNDIKPTNFARRWEKCSLPTLSREDDDFPPIRERHASDACSDPQVKSSPLRRSPPKGSDSAGNALKKARLETRPIPGANGLDIIFNTASSRSRKKALTTYGSQSKKQGPRGSQPNSNSSPDAAFKRPPTGI